MRERTWAGLVPIGTGLVAFLVYASTASRTITWWEGSNYPLAAVSLGITGPPGSLVLTLLGWAWLHLPLAGAPEFRLSLLAGLIAATTAGLVAFLATRLATIEGRPPGAIERGAGALAGLAFACALSVWTYAVRFTPYMLTAAFTALLLVVALAWWRDGKRGQLFLLFLLLGLDFSVHRTNLLLLPALLLWITLRRPRAWTEPRTWAAIASGAVLGLAFHLLLIPLSRRDPWFDLGNTRDLSSLWSYVKLDQFGGGFLFKMLPRKADFLRVQLADYVLFLRQNLAAWPLVLAGWIVAFRRDSRRTLGLFALFVCASLGAVAYFNVPPKYFRPMDRHYLPSLTILAPLLGVGAAAALRLAGRLPVPVRVPSTAAIGLVLALVPLSVVARNRAPCDLSRARFAESYARDVLETLPPDALLFTNGDNDTFPLWYLQRVHGVRPDVSVLNLPLLNMEPYVARLRRSDPRFSALPKVVVNRWATPEQARVALAGEPDSLTVGYAGPSFPVDAEVLALVRESAAVRPVCVACTVSRPQLEWLWPHLRFDGMSFRLAASSAPSDADLAVVRDRLLRVARYEGIADTTVALDPTTRGLGTNYVAALNLLAQAELERGRPANCLLVVEFAERRVPWARLGLESDPFADLRARASAALLAGH